MGKRFAGLKVLVIVFLLALAVLADAPRVAVVKVNSGEVTLDGKPVRTAALASEGQTLVMGKDAKVRLMLLDSQLELTLDGKREVNIRREALNSAAKKVSRGAVAVASDIGSRNTKAASLQRTVPQFTDLGLRPKLPPVQGGSTFYVEFENPAAMTSRNGEMTLSLYDKASGELLQSDSFECSKPLAFWEIRSPLVRGRTYLVEFTLGRVVTLSQTFRILGPEERAFLGATVNEIRERYDQTGDPELLISLASIYGDLDQNEEMLSLLRMALAEANLTPSVRSEIEEQIREIEPMIEFRLPKPSPAGSY